MQKYQVIARKYRPQTFQEVVGQEVIVTTLKNAIALNKVAHAYLFCGGRGTGKTTLARLFAKVLNCEKRTVENEPCNKCSSCQEIMAGQCLDVIEIDGASNRGIDDIRQINEMVGYVPSHGRYKIYIIDEVHMLTKEAFNALLKTLEEPPAQAKFFFATTEAHKILPTIISRCQRFDLGRIAVKQIISKLSQIATDLSRDVEMGALHQIADLSDGSLRDAESLFDQILCFQDGRITVDHVRQVFGLVSEAHFFALDQAFSDNTLSFAFELVNTLFISGKDLGHFFTQLINHYRLVAIAKTLGQEALPPPLAAQYMQTSRNYTQAQSLYLLEYLITTEANLAKSLSPRISLENTLLHIIRTKNRIPIEVLVRRLTELEETLASSEKPSLEIKPEAAKPKPIVGTQRETVVAKPIIEAKPEPVIAKSEPIVEAKLEPVVAKSEPIIEEKPESIPAKPEPTKPEPIVEAKQEEKLSVGMKKHISYYDTLMRFAAVELEGSLKK